MKARLPLSAAAGAALLGLLACRTVFAVGWEEMLVVGLIAAFLLGPLIFRLARAWVKFQEAMKKDKD